MNLRVFKTAVFTIVAIMGFSQIFAQEPTIIQGKKAKATVLSNLAGGISYGISPNQQYLYGALGDAMGFYYDLKTGTTNLSDKSTIQTFSSPTHYAGVADVPAALGLSAVTFYNGSYIPLELTYDTAIKEFLSLSVWAATPDGNQIAIMGDKRILNPMYNRLATVNLPFIYDGTTGKIIEALKPHWPMLKVSSDEDANTGYGARVNGLSDDGSIAVGHSSWPAHMTNRSPVFWDRTLDTSFFVGEEKERLSGSLYCCNKDGSIIVGQSEEDGIVVYYNRAQKTFTTKIIKPSAGYTWLSLSAIKENGDILGFQQTTGQDVFSRVPFIYTKDGDFILLSTYLTELYGLNMGSVPLFTIMEASSDGRTIAGYTYEGQNWLPYAIELGENQMYALPRFAQARQYTNALKVQISWTVPLKGQYTLSGYNIYRDSVKLNTAPLATNTIKFEDVSVTAGNHKYQVQAIYTDGVSDYTSPISVMVIAVGGCYPIQSISNTVAYNRTANIHWGLPSSQIEGQNTPSAPRPANEKGFIEQGPQAKGLLPLSSKGYKNYTFDFVNAYNFHTMSSSSALLIDDTVYSGDYQSTGLKLFSSKDFRLLSEMHPKNLPAIMNMVEINGSIYCACGNTNVYVLDLETKSISGILPIENMKVRHIAYIPELDNGKGGLEIGDWQSSAFYSLDGIKLTNVNPIDFSKLSVTGTTYYKGTLYAFSQTGKNYSQIYYYDVLPNSNYTGDVFALKGSFEVASIAQVQNLLEGGACYAGGLSLNVLEDSTVVLGAVLQCEYTYNHLVYLEIASAPNLAGFNLLRNGTKINTELLKSRNYTDIITTAGTYSYTVEAVQENGCKATSAVSTKLEIYPIGTCPAPKQTKAFESNDCAVLNWDYTPDPNAKLVGFNIYQNE
ncbi:MAG: hypothetical protein RR084_06040, partial [Bacteroidales bacterium]